MPFIGGKINQNLAYAEEPLVKKNPFINKIKDLRPLPKYNRSKKQLPAPFWEGHDNAIAAYDYAWKTAFKNLRRPHINTKFVSRFIDTAFNDFLFMWDSSFIVMFGRYGSRAFDFQKTLDNFYSCQHKDGYISREIYEKRNGERFSRDDPAGTGPNILAWSEWVYYQNSGDKKRLGEVFYPLFAYYNWLKLNRTWRDGTYWTSGLACGMDNSPRVPDGFDHTCSNGHTVWIDACCQQLMNAKILIEMGKILGREAETAPLIKEEENLTRVINDKLWSEKDAYYYDLWTDPDTGKDVLSGVKTLASYWTLLADIIPKERLEGFVAHLDNVNEFNRPHRAPSLSADHPLYKDVGGYWLGSVWAPTNYMVLNGLAKNGFHRLSYDIARNHLDNVLTIFDKTGTLWENYSPEHVVPGKPAKRNFVGWTGLVPISVMFEFVFGIRADAKNNTIEWRVNLTEKHGIKNYPFNGGSVDLECAARKDGETPVITVKSDIPVTVKVYFEDKLIKEISAGK